ncbi:uncharacterized protein LOC135377985 isoform X2 [Ornithodoros turicata]|uniref:uncharacterized protein LOC135377985 isoform X2 n=1 Tax=Ornithodoros turicata TaxID=34597 RepID=UPI0031397A73
MSKESDVRICERCDGSSQAVLMNDALNPSDSINGCDSEDADEELHRVLFDVGVPTPEDEYTTLLSEIARQLSVIAHKDVPDYEKLQEKERVLEFAVRTLSAQSRELIATVSALKKEADSRMVELDRYLSKTAHATKDVVVNLSNWGQEIKDLIITKYQAQDALKQSHSKMSQLITENTALRDQNANLSHDIQSLLKIIHQARTTGNWEMECVTFCEIIPEDVYGPVCGMSFKHSHDSSDWADMVNGSTKPESPQYTTSENGSLSHCLPSEPWMQPSELHTFFEVQRLERKLVECQLEILEKDKIIADLEGQITSLNYEVTVKDADCEEHLSDLYWYQAMSKGTFTCPRSSMLSLRNYSTPDQPLKRPHLVHTSTQADFSSAPKDQLCFTPYAESCPSLHTTRWDDSLHHFNHLRKPRVNCTLDNAEHTTAALTSSTSKHCQHTVCCASANSPVCGAEPSIRSEALSSCAAEACVPRLKPTQNSHVQSKERQTLDAATQTQKTFQQCKPANGVADSGTAQRLQVTLKQSPPQLPPPTPVVAYEAPVLPTAPKLEPDSFSNAMQNSVCHPTHQNAGDSCQAWPSNGTLECGVLQDVHEDVPHGPSGGRSFQAMQHLLRTDSHSQTECSNVAMAVQTDFKLEETAKGVKNQEVESLKERLAQMEERVSSKDILLSQLHTHLETACKEVELKDKALENVERKLNVSRQQCDTFKNDVLMLNHKAKELEENLKEVVKQKHDMEDAIQTMKVTEHKLHEQKRSLLIQLDSAAEESVKYKEEAQLLRKELALKEIEVKHQFKTISNLQEALLDSKNALKSSQPQVLSTKSEGYSTNGQIHTI